MPVSNSVIRRYTPPTCTLEVLAQSSPLSRWMGKTVLKELRFDLRFDDPRLPDDVRIQIQGDGDQLEALYIAVTNYVQEFLEKSPENFWSTFSSSHDSSTPLDEQKVKDFNYSLVPAKTLNTFSSKMPGASIRLEASTHLIHNLFLGPLANQTSGPVVQLSLLQLFDLASALDEYSADVMALPSLNSSSSRSSFSLPNWAPVAAVLVLGVGLAPLSLQYANNRIKQKQTTAKNTQTSQEIALQPSPSPTLENSFPPLGTPLSSTPPLGISSTPPATFPTFPGGTSSTLSPISPTGTFPTASKTSPNSTLTTTPLPSTGTQLTIPGTPAVGFSTNSRTPILAGVPTQKITIQSNLNQNRTGRNSQPGIGLAGSGNLPSSTLPITPGKTPKLSPVPPPLAGIANNNPTADLGNQAYSQPDARQLETVNSAASTSVANNDSPLVTRLRNGTTTSRSTEVAGGTLFDTPQVAEARNYLKSRWQPPAGLAQKLEYSLVVGVDGRIERIFPLAKAARDYIDSAGMPGIGQPFVSPNRNGQNVRIRAVLWPDGKVQTFPESE